ncbi:helix-turn-helix transcriptional regulator [Alicyclobacillus sp. SO9]|uniref:ArsR/SmtB family transcription factor n=1 Tax=Alicyclobacillus sp. SO9 TaxID=2665646 RepID=UPI0018E879E3|nr:winged helix-turn-helix domain-containing protein [Alicyclobacillus sp. SO9]QQE80028.1 winged helix-turn-helix transcriptional regulator [Alicyclobacillus sp. SO9]
MVYENITTVAALIGDKTRTAILLALADGRALPAGELAKMAGVSPQTASNHLAKLVEGKLITVEAWSRHRYYRLAGSDVANMLEAIASCAPPSPIRSLRQSEQVKALRHARTCYNHIAGELGVRFTEALVTRTYLKEANDGFLLTPEGETWLRNFGIAKRIIGQAHVAVPWHNDWTERVHHIAGPVALAVTKKMFEMGWIDHGRIRRSITVTPVGREAFAREFGIYHL